MADDREPGSMPPGLVAKVEAVLAEHPGLRGQPATDEQIEAAQHTLGVVFDPQYVAFIKRFGGSFAGVDIHAFANGAMVGRETVTGMTQGFREGCGDRLTPELRDALVISGDGGGNDVLVTAQGEVVLYLHEEGEVERLFPSLYDMMEAWLP